MSEIKDIKESTDPDEDDVRGIYIYIENHLHGFVRLWPSIKVSFQINDLVVIVLGPI